MHSPVLPETAPFSSDQRQWLNGFLAGLQNLAFGAIPVPPGELLSAPPETPKLQVQVLYGSQSGNAEGLAHALGERLRRGGGGVQARVAGLDAFKEIDWAREGCFLMVCSTWGEGDMPDNAVAFWEWLKSPAAPKLEHARFAVLGLGDRNYRRFCHAGRSLDERFAELGAKRLLPFCACEADYETQAQGWMEEASGALRSLAGAETPASPNAGDIAVPADETKDEGKPRFDRKHPFPASLLENRPLNARESAKDTRHIALSLLGSELQYAPGDALGVWARNCYDLVDRLILALNCVGDERVVLAGGEPAVLRSALLEKLDARRAPASLLLALRKATTNISEQRRLDGLLADAEGDAQRAYLEERDVLDVLHDFPRTRLEPQALVETLPRLAPRLYSIASSPLAHPDEVHLCVGVQRTALRGRMRRGVASTFLAERVPLGMTVPVFLQPTRSFSLPEKSGTPIIMVGPGTGIAPFRAFLEQRQKQGDAGPNWLFFGDQHQDTDFLYADEIHAWHRDGFLTRLDLAFSRDQEEKIYVQTRMREQARELFAWLERGAHFYVCGDAKRMAKDVDAALREAIMLAGGQGPDQAQAYVETMKKDKRYARDVY